MSKHVLSRAEALAVLGLGESASDAEVRRAYRKLVLRYHPDRHPGNPQAQARFMEIVLAKDTLKRLGDTTADRPPAVPASQMPPPPALEPRKWPTGSPSYSILLLTIAATGLLGFVAYGVMRDAATEQRALLERPYFQEKRSCLRETNFKYFGGVVLIVNAALVACLGITRAFRPSSSRERSRRQPFWRTPLRKRNYAPFVAIFLCAATILVTAYPLYRRPAPEKPRPAPSTPHPFDQLHRLYVESFIRTFQLDESQSAAARSIVHDLILQRKERSRDGSGMGSGHVPANVELLLERTDLRTRLDPIPTPAQVESAREQMRKYTGSASATTRPTGLLDEYSRGMLPSYLVD